MGDEETTQPPEQPCWSMTTPNVLVTTGAFLEAAGFDVVRARDGDEALAHLASGQTFALLVTDYAMPGLNGVDLATEALERRPARKFF